MDLWKLARPASRVVDGDQGVMDLKVDKDCGAGAGGAPGRKHICLDLRPFRGYLADWFPGQHTVVYLVLHAFSVARNLVDFSGLDRCHGGFIIGLFHYVLRVPWSHPALGWLQESLLEWI